MVNEIDTMECVLGHTSDLKYGDKIMAIDIAKGNNDFKGNILERRTTHDSELGI